MKKHKGDNIHSYIINGGAIVGYIAIFVGYVFICRRNFISVDENIGKNLAKVLLATLSNTVTIAAGIIDIAIAVIIRWKRKDIPQRKVVFVTAVFFAFVYFNAVALEYPLNAEWIVFIDSLFFVLNAVVFLLEESKEPIVQNNRSLRIIGNIKNKNIIAEQLFSLKKTIDGGYVVYELSSVEYASNSEYDVNGILSVTYRLPIEHAKTFKCVLEAYYAFVSDGKEETKKSLITVLTGEKEKITKILRSISSPEAVCPNDCCLARLLIIYLAFLRILNPPVEMNDEEERNNNVEWYGSEAYIGELSLAEGKIGINVEIEKRLFTLLRTGLLGAILVGPGLRYIFSYKKDGYKIGRRYSAIMLPDSEDFICLITLANIRSKTIPSYITGAIRQEEKRIENAVYKLKEGAI